VSDAVIIAIIVGIPATISAVGTVLNNIKMKHVIHNTNSIKDELVQATAKGSFAAGRKAERDDNMANQ
jgi:hypothetical protein